MCGDDHQHNVLTNVCLQTFVQRVNNMVAFVMNMYCWQYVIEPQMDKVFWYVPMRCCVICHYAALITP